MAITTTLHLETATWDDLREYVQAHRNVDGDTPVGYSWTDPHGDIRVELYEQRNHHATPTDRR